MDLEDPRARKDRRCSVGQAVTTLLVGLISGCKGLSEVEDLTQQMSPALNRRLGLRGRMADTTLRDWLCRLPLHTLRGLLHNAVRLAKRRKALRPDGLPFGVVAMDGRGTKLPSWEGPYAQKAQREDGGAPYGVMRTVTSVLVSAVGRPCIDIHPIPAATNEMGVFSEAFDALMTVYARSVTLVSYDAGINSESNARHVVEHGKHYLLRMNNEERHLQQHAQELLALKDVVFESEEHLSATRQVKRTLRVMQVNRGVLPKLKRQPILWPHIKTLLAVDTERVDNGHVTRDTRYYCSSMPLDAMTYEQWLTAIVRHWGVETCHQILDTALEEDNRPWILHDPHAMLNVAILRRLTYTLITLYKNVTLRADSWHEMPWKPFIAWIRTATIGATAQHLDKLRNRKAATATL